MSDNQLERVVQESGLEPSKAQVMLDRFSDAAAMAAEWEPRAAAIVVTDASQVGVMKMAREGRLALKAKRVEIEKTRVELKADIVLQGKAIDGVANFLKALIIPIEKHLDEQEKFVERQEAAVAEARRQAAEEALREKEEREAAAEKTRLAKQAAENERLRKENEEKARELVSERAEADAKLAAQKKSSDAKLARERKAAQIKAQAAADKAAEIAKAEANKWAKEAARKAESVRKQAEKDAAEREAALQEDLRLARMVTCPRCGETFDISQDGKKDNRLP